MASIELTDKSTNYYIRFRYLGRNINRSLGTPNRRTAAGVCSRVEETLRLLDRGRITVPVGTDPVEFILSDGRITKPLSQPKAMGLAEFFRTYRERLPDGRKEADTLRGEEIHVRHFQRHLGPNRFVQSIAKTDLQDYVSKRLKESHNGKAIQPDTVRKELVTFRMLWNWGVEEGILLGPTPTKHVILPLADEKPPFRTRKEIERIIKRGQHSPAERQRLWESLYLEKEEVSLILETIRKNARYPFIYPMMVFVAHTGARRSEMIRSRVEDIDFRSRSLVIREKKKSRSKATTYRRIDMSPLVEQLLDQWLDEHPGGEFTFAQPGNAGDPMPLTPWQARHHLKQTLAKTDWNILRGFHVFRHSFASNLAAAGVDERVIDEFMGHQTEEMRKRYRHLFPGQRRTAIDSVFGDEQYVLTIPTGKSPKSDGETREASA